MACKNNRSLCCQGCNNAYARVSCNDSHCANCSRCCGGASHHSGCGCSSASDCGCNGRSSCSSACRSGYGVLRDVAGPFYRGRGHGCGNTRYPFYTGPCGPCACSECGCTSCNSCNNGCNSCGCDNCGNCNPCDNDCCDSCYNDPCHDDCCEPCCESCGFAGATFTAGTPVELAAGDGVCLNACDLENHDFIATRDGIRFRRAGSYMAVYTVHVPVNESVRSRFVLTLDGDRLATSAQDVVTVEDGSSNGYTMHALVHAEAGSLLKLISLNPVSICASSASNVFTLSLHRVS